MLTLSIVLLLMAGLVLLLLPRLAPRQKKLPGALPLLAAICLGLALLLGFTSLLRGEPTPPEAMTAAAGKRRLHSRYRSRLGPARVPSWAISVHRKCRAPRAQNFSRSDQRLLPLSLTQPRVSTVGSSFWVTRTSKASTRCSGPSRSSHSKAVSGASAATEPTTTRSAPAARRARARSMSLRPPPA